MGVQESDGGGGGGDVEWSVSRRAGEEWAGLEYLRDKSAGSPAYGIRHKNKRKQASKGGWLE